ncbi:CRP/FNR family transcriptional regulator [Aquimarina sp. EL_43]|uniref:Crp/Fnr family transcriptional regulator n=1 Tax=unclassified Aquimarina TaxID=2627091 RepID=UPI0018CA7D59|nr:MULTISPECIES: Crp/Fnr family transcriptional regulator [unclassified Aquimarina]MBG6133568.1 CRP/FNR family transcriptional regulator [Aquimarina sp. EL_35]MBG6153786.1 CRP/FNR family transcriptional regulator [Aquimarina sp. EL_32]MBG6171980.1 CRP/FNR family transcriptional regulator [Aquimarina sp. EL_43]
MTEFEQLFKGLNIVEEKLQEHILKEGVVQTVPKDTFIVEQDKYIKWLAIVISGKVRVWQENEDRQILLYYVNPIQTCVLSLSATFRDCKSLVHAKTEIETTLIKIPVRFVSEWSFMFKSWNTFTTNSFIISYEDLLLSYKDLAFKKINERLIDYLRSEANRNNSSIIEISHQQLAKEVGTTREVVSKILKQYELDHIVQLHFKKIELLS